MENIETDLSEIPLFALSVNALPGAYLPLQIFEPRYLDMVKDRLGKQKGFCVVLMDDNNHVLEEGGLLQHSGTGTYVEVVDFNQLENGLLGITVQGKFRIQVLDRREQEDGLLVGKVMQLKEPEDKSLESVYGNIWKVLEEISEHSEIQKLKLDIDFSSSSSVAYHLASLLPISPLEKQLLLESNSNANRFNKLEDILKKLGG